MSKNSITIGALALLGLSACSFDEGILDEDFVGTVIVDAQAATRNINGTDIVDIKLLGPIYIGSFGSVVPGQFAYPHPEIGPQYIENTPGDTYPYGGTTVGDLRFACLEFLSCKVTTGRYMDFDEILSWFNDTLELPVVDSGGKEVHNGDFIRQTCFTILNLTSDEEIRITATEDRNDDGVIDTADLDFVLNDDGDFEGQFTLWQYEYVQDATLWGWVDTPSVDSFRLSTCNDQAGLRVQEYNQDYWGGRAHQDLLNFPSKYISQGDFVAAGTDPWSDPDEEPVVYIDFLVTDT